jgi:hypothetical protein
MIIIQSKPMTRLQVAELLGISTRTLTRFMDKEGIEVEPRALLKPKLVELLVQKYQT